MGGLVLALAGLGFDQPWLAAAGAGAAVAGLSLRAVVRMRADRAAAEIQRALGGRHVFHSLTETLGGLWRHDWIGHVSWDEDGLGGTTVNEAGGEPPSQAGLTGWLVREAESGTTAIVASGSELGRSGVAIALPLRRDDGALIGFFVVLAGKLPPRHVELALLESLDELGLALAERPALDGGGAEDAEAFEAVPDLRDLALVRGNEG